MADTPQSRVDAQRAQREATYKTRTASGPLLPKSADPIPAKAELPTFEPHPLAERFPLIEGAEFDELVADIKKNGLMNPVIMYQGKVLDGRNRVMACQEAGVEIRHRPWDGTCGTALAFVVSRNVLRRHLTSSQRAVWAVSLLDDERKAASERLESTQAKPGEKVGAKGSGKKTRALAGRARDQAGRAVGVSGSSVAKAERLVRENPELADAVARGDMTLGQAAREATPPAETVAYKPEWARTGKVEVQLPAFTVEYASVPSMIEQALAKCEHLLKPILRAAEKEREAKNPSGLT